MSNVSNFSFIIATPSLVILATGAAPVTASGWEQFTGSPGYTTTTPINAPVGSNQDGPDIIVEAGAGDGTGNAGNIILRIPPGHGGFDIHNTPDAGVVLLDCPSNYGVFTFAQPYIAAPDVFSGMQFYANSGDLLGGDIAFYSGSGILSGAGGGNIRFQGGQAHGGGGGNFFGTCGADIVGGGSGFNFSCYGGDGVGNAGGGSFLGGTSGGIGGTGGSISFLAGTGENADAGGYLDFEGGSSSSGPGGDISFAPGTNNLGTPGRLFFNNIPSTDPGASHAVWNNNGVYEESGNSLPSGTITLAALTALGTQGSITVVSGIITAFTNPT